MDRNVRRRTKSGEITIPIVATRRGDASETWIDLYSPIAPDVPVSVDLRSLGPGEGGRIYCVDDLLVRRHLPAAVEQVRAALV
jgi:hypothetical protein